MYACTFANKNYSNYIYVCIYVCTDGIVCNSHLPIVHTCYVHTTYIHTYII